MIVYTILTSLDNMVLILDVANVVILIITSLDNVVLILCVVNVILLVCYNPLIFSIVIFVKVLIKDLFLQMLVFDL